MKPLRRERPATCAVFSYCLRIRRHGASCALMLQHCAVIPRITRSVGHFFDGSSDLGGSPSARRAQGGIQPRGLWSRCSKPVRVGDGSQGVGDGWWALEIGGAWISNGCAFVQPVYQLQRLRRADSCVTRIA